MNWDPYDPPERVEPEKAAEKTRMVVTLEEKAFLSALRESRKMGQQLADEVPYLSMETLALVHFVVIHELDGEALKKFMLSISP